MNTPLNAAPISGRDGLPQPTVATIGEDEEDEAQGGNPASVLARVSFAITNRSMECVCGQLMYIPSVARPM